MKVASIGQLQLVDLSYMLPIVISFFMKTIGQFYKYKKQLCSTKVQLVQKSTGSTVKA